MDGGSSSDPHVPLAVVKRNAPGNRSSSGGKLELAFYSKSLRTLCEDDQCAKEKFPPIVAEALKHRLADLKAASSPIELIAGRPRTMADPSGGQLLIELEEGYRLIIVANHPDNPATDRGVLDWANVSRLKLLRIENDHG